MPEVCSECGGDLKKGGCHHKHRGAGGFETIIPPSNEESGDGGF